MTANANVCHHIGPATGSPTTYHGVYCSSTGATITNSLSYANGGGGVHCWHDARNVAIVNNTCFANVYGVICGGGDYVNLTAPADYFTVRNNLLAYNTTGVRELGDVGAHSLVDHNLCYANVTAYSLLVSSHTSDVTGDPLFVNYQGDGSGDYRLGTSSPAIGAGSLTLSPATDLNGAARALTNDVGAYKTGTSSGGGGGGGGTGGTGGVGSTTPTGDIAGASDQGTRGVIAGGGVAGDVGGTGAVTSAQYAAWLRDPQAVRVLLFEVGVNSAGVESTRYFSSRGFVSAATDTPASTAYPGIAAPGLAITESLPLDQDFQLTVGDIEIDNVDGARDGWLLDVWTNRAARVYLGDARWPRADFRLVFSGVVADVGSAAVGTLNLILSNKLAQLNTAMTDRKWGGDGTYVQSGLTVTVTKPRHGRVIGSPVEAHPTTGLAVAGSYAVTTTPTDDTFTYTAGAPLTTSGTMRIEGVNFDALMPLTLGECHNVTPLLVDGTKLRYSVHDGACHQIFEVRDNGKPVTVTTDAATGTFCLLASPAGQITATVLGDDAGGTSYVNTVGSLIWRVVQTWGVASQRLTPFDIDTASLAAFDLSHLQPVGVYVAARTNVLDVCQQLASSVDAKLAMTRLGLLRLVRLDFPPAGTPVPIGPADMVEHTLEVVARSTVTASVKLNYVKNWTVQAGLQTSIPAEHKEMFASEWWSATATDAPTAALYRLNAEPVPEDTLMLVLADAQNEAVRRLAIRRVPRTTYRFTGTAAHLELELGQGVTLTHPRFGLAAGVAGVVTSLSPDWLNCRVTVDVTV